MLAQLKTVVLIKEAIKLAFFRLVQYLSINNCGFDNRLKMSRKELSSETRQSILVLRNKGYSMWEIAKKLKILYNAVYLSLQRTVQTVSKHNRKRSGRPRCTTEREDKNIRVSSLINRRLTSPQLAASLNSTAKHQSQRQQWRGDSGMLDFYAELQRKSHISDWPIKRKDGQKNTDTGLGNSA